VTSGPRTGLATGRRRTGRVTWGISDAVLCWIAGGVVAGIVGIPLYNRLGVDLDPVYTFGLLLPAQQVTVILAIYLVSRWKGRGSLAADFGLRFGLRWADTRALAVGAALEMMLAAAVLPLLTLSREAEPQQLLRDLNQSRGAPPVFLFVIGAVVLAPLVEELLYRGLLLRALLRRMEPAGAVFSSAIVFALVHYVGDPGTLPFLPALTALGVVLGLVALRTGTLKWPILIHAGFNLTTTILFLTAASP
jgi:membrane protease YdiL (CAAX protease family)